MLSRLRLVCSVIGTYSVVLLTYDVFDGQYGFLHGYYFQRKAICLSPIGIIMTLSLITSKKIIVKRVRERERERERERDLLEFL